MSINPNDPTAYIPPTPQQPRHETLAYTQQNGEPYYEAAQPITPTEPPMDNRGAYPPPQPEPRPRPSFDVGVDLPKYVGSAVATAVVAALVGYFGILLVNTIVTWIPDTYWIDRGLIRPDHNPTIAAWLAAASAILAAGIMWLILKITARTGLFFSAITTLIGAIGFLAILSTGPWQTTLGLAALFAAAAAVIGSLTSGYTRLCTTRPQYY